MKTLTQKFYNLEIIWVNVESKHRKDHINNILKPLFGVDESISSSLYTAQYIAKYFNVNTITIERVNNWRELIEADCSWLHTFRIKALAHINNKRNKMPQQLVNDNAALVWSINQFMTEIGTLSAIAEVENYPLQLNVDSFIIRNMANAVKSTIE